MKKLLLISIILIIPFIVFSEVKAVSASLYLSPSTGDYTVGNTFSVQVKVNSGGVAINAADGILVFDPDKLEVKSISKANSVFSLWVQEPNFSNSLGTINFAGGRPSPGFAGASGAIITVTLKGKTSSTANLTFAAGSVLADDGKGTNILTHMGAGSYKFTAKEITPLSPPGEEYISPVTTDQAPAAPVVSSETHPKENKWYSNNNPEFSWKLPSDITEMRLLINEIPASIPSVLYIPAISEKKVEDLTDGIWYFHVRFKNQYGWGDITHRKVLIDTKSPESFEVTIDNEGISTNPTPILYFKSEDSLSGIDYYQVKIGDWLSSTTAASTKISPYRPSPQPPGTHPVEVRALDKAGNFSLASTEILILPIEAPEITEIPVSIRIGEALVIKGEALPELTVRIYIQKIDEEPILERVKPDSEGKFVLTYEKVLAKGDYLVWAQSEDERGALSYPTKKYSLEVGLPPFLKFGKIAIDYLTTMITLIILIVGAAAAIIYIGYRVSIWRKSMRKETKDVSRSVTKAFRSLRKEIEGQIAMLDKKPGLTKREKELRDKLQESLDTSERSIGREIKDIEEELE